METLYFLFNFPVNLLQNINSIFKNYGPNVIKHSKTLSLDKWFTSDTQRSPISPRRWFTDHLVWGCLGKWSRKEEGAMKRRPLKLEPQLPRISNEATPLSSVVHTVHIVHILYTFSTLESIKERIAQLKRKISKRLKPLI